MFQGFALVERVPIGLYALGYTTANPGVGTTETFVAETGSFTTRATNSTARRGVIAGWHGGKAIHGGGYTNSLTVATADLYDSASHSWSSATAMTSDATNCEGFSIQGVTYRVHGGTGSAPNIISTCLKYSYVGNSWSSFTSAPEATQWHFTFTSELGDGWRTGGSPYNSASTPYSKNANKYVVSGNSWTSYTDALSVTNLGSRGNAVMSNGAAILVQTQEGFWDGGTMWTFKMTGLSGTPSSSVRTARSIPSMAGGSCGLRQLVYTAGGATPPSYVATNYGSYFNDRSNAHAATNTISQARWVLSGVNIV